jgi:hypothetical protein
MRRSQGGGVDLEEKVPRRRGSFRGEGTEEKEYA